jgi:pimeloyl-ACP methyl ester carboxylesterase
VLECALVDSPPTAAEIEAVSRRVPAYLHPLDANDVMIARCAEELEAQGIDLAHYDTATHARDLLDLLITLGYSQYNLVGTSYGTRIALEVLRVDPSGVRAVVLDSIYPPTVNAYEMQHSLATLEVLANAFAQCAADPKCGEAYPNLAARFDDAMIQLNAQPLALPLSWQPEFNGDDLLSLMLARLDRDLLIYLPRLVDELAQRESTTLLALLRGDVPPPAPPRPMPISGADETRVTEFVLALNGALMTEQLQMDSVTLREWQQLTARNPDRSRLSLFIEGYEDFSVSLSNLQGAMPGSITDTLVIIEDDDIAYIGVGDVTVDEEAGSVALLITQSVTSTLESMVDFRTVDGSATSPDDYTAVSGTVSIPAGELQAVVTVTITSDEAVESMESFIFQLEEPLNAELSNITATVTIVDDDGLPQLTLNPASAYETDGFLPFVITLNMIWSEDVMVDYATLDGSATAPDDYLTNVGTLTIPAGSLTATVPVTLVNDFAREPDETMSLTLKNPTQATLATAQAVGVILGDNEQLYLPKIQQESGDGR